MLLFYMMSGKIHPFGYGSHTDVEHNIANGTQDLSPVQDTVAVDLVQTMLTHDPTKRPSTDDVLK